MTSLTRVMTLVLALSVFSPAVFADDDTSVSYSLKKQGRVHFQDKADATEAVTDTSAEFAHPAEIEPAAGVEETTNAKEDTALSDRIRLPRKN